jgi:hypothetical protein
MLDHWLSLNRNKQDITVKTSDRWGLCHVERHCMTNKNPPMASDNVKLEVKIGVEKLSVTLHLEKNILKVFNSISLESSNLLELKQRRSFGFQKI